MLSYTTLTINYQLTVCVIINNNRNPELNKTIKSYDIGEHSYQGYKCTMQARFIITISMECQVRDEAHSIQVLSDKQ